MSEGLHSYVKEYCLASWRVSPEVWEPLVADGSSRHFFRVGAEQRSVVVLSYPEGRSTGQNDAYVAIGRHLREREIPVPTIHAYHREEGWVIMEDLGDRSLHQAVFSSTNPEDILALYGPVLDLLVTFQLGGGKGFQDAWCYQGARYDFDLMVDGESGYFLRSFLEGYLGWSGTETPLRLEFEALARMASSAPIRWLIHRDFQSRNVLLPVPETPHLIDFQGARWGPLQYDVAALVIDPYVPLSLELRRAILTAYLERLESSGLMHPDAFMQHYPLIALHRNLQILGAFAFLGWVKQKDFFLQWIPEALNHLYALLEDHKAWDCPHLREVIAEACETIARKGGGHHSLP